ADSVERAAKAGKPMTRSNLRDAIQAAKVTSIQGPIAFDANGDILTKTVSIYQWRGGEIKYVTVAPEKKARIGRPPAGATRRRPGEPSPAHAACPPPPRREAFP